VSLPLCAALLARLGLRMERHLRGLVLAWREFPHTPGSQMGHPLEVADWLAIALHALHGPALALRLNVAGPGCLPCALPYPDSKLEGNFILYNMALAITKSRLPLFRQLLPPTGRDAQQLGEWLQAADFAVHALAQMCGYLALGAVGCQPPAPYKNTGFSAGPTCECACGEAACVL
jgi:hypothetical protein